MTPVSVLVVIVNYRTAALTLDAVASLAPAIAAHGDAHVVVVDNGSGDGSAEAIADGIAARDFGGWCSLLPVDRNGGFAAGNNAGIDWYRGETGMLPALIWLVNPDTVAEPGALDALVRFMGDHPAAGIAGGRTLWQEGGVRDGAFHFPSARGDFVSAVRFGPLARIIRGREIAVPMAEEPRRVDWVGGSSFMIRGQVVEAVGMMDEGYFLYFEEVDYCARAADAGFECWSVPDSRIVHIGGQSTGVTGTAGRAGRRPRYWFAARARFFAKRYGIGRTHLANLLWLSGYPIGRAIALFRGRETRDPPLLWWDFLRNYYGKNGIMYRGRSIAA